MVKIVKVVTIAKEDGKVKVHVNIEGLRTLQYVFFYFVVALGMTLTHLYGDVNWEDNIILKYFGANNVCINFDYPPASWVLPFFWAVTSFVMVIERLAVLVRVWLSRESHGLITRAEYVVVTCAVVYQILSYWFFALIFAVQPVDLHTLRIHSLPYTNLIMSLALMAMTNVWYAWRVGYQHFGFPPWFKYLTLPYIVVLILVSVHQVIHQVHTLTFEEPWMDAPFPLNLSLGNVWLFLVIVVPPAWNLYLNCRLPHKAVQISMEMNLSIGSEDREIQGVEHHEEREEVSL